MSDKRTPLGKFIHNSWGNMNVRCGKYKHLQTENKCKVYQGKEVLFTYLEYKNWCYSQKENILSLERPSLDRIDSTKNYSFDNIRVIELKDNIQRKKYGSRYVNGSKSNEVRGISKTESGKWRARIHINKCEIHLGSFETKEEAIYVFKEAYFKHYRKYPF